MFFFFCYKKITNVLKINYKRAIYIELIIDIK